MLRRFGLTSAALAACVSAIPASGATFLFAFTGADANGSGTFITSDAPLAGGGLSIIATGGSATIGSSTGSFIGRTSFAGADNLLYPSGARYLSFDGTSVLSSNGASYNFYYSSDDGAYRIFTSASRFITLASFTLTSPDAAVPEPASWLLMLCGMGMIGAMLRLPRGARRQSPPGPTAFKGRCRPALAVCSMTALALRR